MAFPNQAAKMTGPQGTAGTADDHSYRSVIFGTNHAALIWRIGSEGQAFPFTAGGALTAPFAGRLFLGINDLEPCNNGGAFTATIQGGAKEATITPLPTPTTVAACA